jgi:hypothetical protein
MLLWNSDQAVVHELGFWEGPVLVRAASPLRAFAIEHASVGDVVVSVSNQLGIGYTFL